MPNRPLAELVVSDNDPTGFVDLSHAWTLIQSSTAAFPTAGASPYSDDPNAEPVEIIPDCDWTEGMRAVYEYTTELAYRLLDKSVAVEFVQVPPRLCGAKSWRACYGRGYLSGSSLFHYNVGVLGNQWFEQGGTEKVDQLILHELAHEFESNHLSEGYHKAICALGAKLKRLALEDSAFFRKAQRP